MNKTITPVIFLSVFFIYSSSYSQLYFNSEYIGFIKTNQGNIITYNVVFSCNSFECDGYSISDQGGVNETKSIVKGRINNESGFIELKESEIVYTKADYSTFDEFCYVNFSIPYKSYFKEKTKRLTTNYKGYFLDGEVCSDGNLELVLSEDLERQIQKIRDDFLNKQKVKKFMGDSLSSVIKQKLDSLEGKLLKRKKSSFFTKEINRDEIKSILLQDIGRRDGDQIEIQTNKETINVELTKRLKKINIKETDFVNLIGVSEGKNPTIPIRLILETKTKELRETIILREKDTFKIKLVKRKIKQ